MFLLCFTGPHDSFFQLGFLAPPGLQLGHRESSAGPEKLCLSRPCEEASALFSVGVALSLGEEEHILSRDSLMVPRNTCPTVNISCSSFDEGDASLPVFHTTLSFLPVFAPTSGIFVLSVGASTVHLGPFNHSPFDFFRLK